MEPKITIRMATKQDAPALLGIYEPYVKNTAITFEYTVPSIEEFSQRIEDTLQNFPYLVAQVYERPVGYAYVSKFKARAAYAWSVETSIYVDMNSRSMGIGTALYQKLEEVLAKQNILNVNACIAYPNPASVAFHEHMGYKTIAHFTKCGYKLNQWYDMIWMEKMLGKHTTPPKPFLSIQQLQLDL